VSGLIALGVVLAIIAVFDLLVALFGAESRPGFDDPGLTELPTALRWSSELR
jgi:hypothetical protein